MTWLTSWLQHGCRRLYHVLGRNIEHAEVFEPDAYRSNRCRIQAEGLGSMQGQCIELPKIRPCQKKETVPRNLCNSNGYAKASKEIRKLLGRERRSTSRLGENNNDLRKEAK